MELVMNNLVRIFTDDDGVNVYTGLWCVKVVRSGEEMALCTGDFLFNSGVEYEEKETKRGGITCQRCMEIIKEIKGIKL